MWKTVDVVVVLVYDLHLLQLFYLALDIDLPPHLRLNSREEMIAACFWKRDAISPFLFTMQSSANHKARKYFYKEQNGHGPSISSQRICYKKIYKSILIL
jgi:hypothetical protein